MMMRIWGTILMEMVSSEIDSLLAFSLNLCRIFFFVSAPLERTRRVVLFFSPSPSRVVSLECVL